VSPSPHMDDELAKGMIVPLLNADGFVAGVYDRLSAVWGGDGAVVGGAMSLTPTQSTNGC
jgi:hypothetical protein